MPTPFERTSRTTCSTCSRNALLASLNSRCASSKKNTSFGLSSVADLGELVVELGEHPHHEGREQRRPVLDVGQLEDADAPAAVGRGLHQVGDLELRLAEQRAGALLLQLHHLAQQHADRRLRDAAVVALQLRARVGQVGEHRAQVLEVEQRQAAIVAVLEHQRQDARLRVVEAHHLAERQRPERRHRGAQLRAQLAAQAQELDRESGRAPADADLLRAALDLRGRARPERPARRRPP